MDFPPNLLRPWISMAGKTRSPGDRQTEMVVTVDGQTLSRGRDSQSASVHVADARPSRQFTNSGSYRVRRNQYLFYGTAVNSVVPAVKDLLLLVASSLLHHIQLSKAAAEQHDVFRKNAAGATASNAEPSSNSISITITIPSILWGRIHNINISLHRRTGRPTMILFTHHPLLLLLAVAALMSLSPSIITSLLTSSSSHHHSCSGAALALYLPPSTPAILHHRHYHHHQFRSRRRRHHFDVITSFYHDTSLHYKEPNSPNTSDDHNDASSSSASNNGGVGDSSGNNNNNNFNAWSVLANTERWIVDTLDRSNSAEAARRLHNAETIEKQQQQKNKLHFADEKVVPPPPPKDNPYARKEISYVCETQPDLLSVVGGIFRRVREARELGESHGRNVVMATPGLGEFVVFVVCVCVCVCVCKEQ
jgi:hypothetical protein